MKEKRICKTCRRSLWWDSDGESVCCTLTQFPLDERSGGDTCEHWKGSEEDE